MNDSTTKTAAQQDAPTYRSIADNCVTELDVANQNIAWAAATLRLAYDRLLPDLGYSDAVKALDFVAKSLDTWANDLEVSTSFLEGQLEGLHNGGAV